MSEQTIYFILGIIAGLVVAAIIFLASAAIWVHYAPVCNGYVIFFTG